MFGLNDGTVEVEFAVVNDVPFSECGILVLRAALTYDTALKILQRTDCMASRIVVLANKGIEHLSTLLDLDVRPEVLVMADAEPANVHLFSVGRSLLYR